VKAGPKPIIQIWIRCNMSFTTGIMTGGLSEEENKKYYKFEKI